MSPHKKALVLREYHDHHNRIAHKVAELIKSDTPLAAEMAAVTAYFVQHASMEMYLRELEGKNSKPLPVSPEMQVLCAKHGVNLK